MSVIDIHSDTKNFVYKISRFEATEKKNHYLYHFFEVIDALQELGKLLTRRWFQWRC